MIGYREVATSRRISLTLKSTINNMKRAQAMVPLSFGFVSPLQINEAHIPAEQPKV